MSTEFAYLGRLTDAQIDERLQRITRLVNESDDPEFIADSADIFAALVQEKAKRHGIVLPWWRRAWIALTSWSVE